MNILIIEDDTLWQLKLQMMIHELQFQTISIANTLSEAKYFLEQEIPDLVLADIILPDGDTVSFFTKKYRDVPVIYISSYANDQYLKEALVMPYLGFLVKPFDKLTLKASIDILLTRILPKSPPIYSGLNVIGKYNERIKIPLSEIFWIKTEGNYSIIYTNSNKYVLKRSLRKMTDELSNQFVQVQKGYVVNSDYVESVKPDSVQINSHDIPLGRKFKKKLLDCLKLKNY